LRFASSAPSRLRRLFTVRDLRERTGELIRDAEAGKLSVYAG